ncbi:MAG: hypothetical protein LBP87_03265 [Planctomycetaceae bacterium]|jgi:hypothetical protein|nr:hypothetical protein [Planctomycetaceae bacterium]
MDTTKFKGRVTAQIEDKDGNIKQSCTVENTVTDAFLKRALFASLNANNPGVALRAASKPTTGQFAGFADNGAFGIYALNRDITITTDTVVPPYVTNAMTAYTADTTFYNNGNTVVESAKELIPVDNRSVYRRKAGDNSFIVEYVKNSGVGSVKSICFGRHYNLPQNVTGIAIGEAIYQAIWTTGTVEYFLEQTLTGTPTEACPKGNQQETIVWKQVSSSSQFSANLVTKQVTTYNNSNLSSNLLNSNLVGGHVFDNGSGTKTVVKAVYSALDATAKTHTLLLYYNTDITGSTTVSSRTVTITLPEWATPNFPNNPIMVSRPDTGKLEIFATVAQGEFTIPAQDEGDPTTGTGCLVYKLTLETPTDPAASEITEEQIGIIPYGIAAYPGSGAIYYLSGFYFADLQNDDAGRTDKENPEGTYYLPYAYYRSATENLSLSDNNWAMGLILSDDLSTVKNHYLARTSSSQQFNAPVMTDSGVLYCRVNSTTMYYVTLSGVISGTNLPQTLTKGENDILRLIYEYTLTQ